MNRLTVYHLDNLPKSNSFAEDVKTGLTSKNKFLHPKYFYDNHGSELFEKICETEEYYPTRTELGILKKLSGTISERNRDKNLIVELGSGSSYKTDFILSSFLEEREKLDYVPIDVSDILIESSEKLIRKYPKLFITGIISFYEKGMEFIVARDSSPKLVLFLGSSIGNFTKEEQSDFMKMLSGNLNRDDRLLIGFDMVKSREVLEAAYNDSEGITAEFNLNILRRINNELNADFDLDKFKHIALFNEPKSRIEMHLEAKEEMIVSIGSINEKVHFKKGERIHTENSYKFTSQMIDELARASGMEFSDCYTDDQNYFSLCAFRPL